MTAQISDLTTATRLLTGAQLEIQDVAAGSKNVTIDTLASGIVFDSPTQLVGNTAANTMEVEANSLAARLSARPDETNNPQAGWKVGRYAFSSSQMYTPGSSTLILANNTTGVAAVTDGIHLVFAWVNTGGICVIKRVTGFMVTGAQGANGTVGMANMKLTRAYGLGPALAAITTDNIPFPPTQGGNAPGGETPVQGTTGLKTNQPPSQAQIHIVPLNTTAQAFTDPLPLGIITASRPAAGVGTNQFRGQDLYDYRVADQPLVLVPTTGFQITITMPAGATSQSVHCFVNMTWDEWTPVSPGDR
jgi:hypothetical protein